MTAAPLVILRIVLVTDSVTHFVYLLISTNQFIHQCHGSIMLSIMLDLGMELGTDLGIGFGLDLDLEMGM